MSDTDSQPEVDSQAVTSFEHSVLASEHGQRIDSVLAMLLNAYSRVF